MPISSGSSFGGWKVRFLRPTLDLRFALFELGCSNPSTRPNPTGWAWDRRSAARLSRPMAGGYRQPEPAPRRDFSVHADGRGADIRGPGTTALLTGIDWSRYAAAGSPSEGAADSYASIIVASYSAAPSFRSANKPTQVQISARLHGEPSMARCGDGSCRRDP